MARFPLPWRRSTDVAKAAPQTPAAIEQALDAQGLNTSTDLGPGRPINPAHGYSTRPRAMDYPVGVNLGAGRTRGAWGRTSFDTLRGLIDAYDIARDCINHKIDELVSMEPLFLPADGVTGDVDAAIDAARAALEFPDRELPFEAWLSKWLEDVFRYDAGTLYRRRNLNGDIIGLEVVDGTTIVPDVDEHGRRPTPPAPAYWQSIKGLPWAWFTSDDVLQTIRRPQPNSPYGLAPIESVLLTVNTDIKYQWHFLQMFTDGSIPGGFIEVPPDVSSPDQVDEWQAYYDSMVLGDQAKLHQLIAIPNGTKVTETRPKAFDRAFPEWLAVRTAMAFGVVPQDLGLTMDVNRANGETQTDMQFRVNTLPWVRMVQGLLTRYLRHDLGLPVQVKLDTGREKEDRKAEAETWAVYVKNGIASADEAREELLGLPTDNERPVPRGILSDRYGFIPLRSLEAIAGPIDPETAAPTEAVPLDTTPYDGAPGVLPDKLPGVPAFRRAEADPDDPRRPQLERPVPGSDTAGLRAAPQPAATVAKSGDVDAELAAFRRFAKARQKQGRWRDFQFTATDQATAHALNQHARVRVRKAAGQVVAAGLAVVAADTGRVLMLQRALDPADPNGGCWEFPGGCLEDGEEAGAAAAREWSEETGLALPAGDWDGSWDAGVYAGYLLAVPSEADVPIFDRADGMNPDDPDGDAVEALAWWEPAQLVGNPAVRPELADALGAVLPLLERAVTQGKASGVAKSWRDGPDTAPQHAYDLAITDHYAPLVARALGRLFTDAQLQAAVTAASGLVAKDAAGNMRQALTAAATAALADPDTVDLEQVIRRIIADGFTAGGWAAAQQVPPGPGAPLTVDYVGDIDWSAWQPGHVDAAIRTADGALAQALDRAGVSIKGVTRTTVDLIGNRVADGLLDGAPVDAIGRTLRGLLGDADRAEMIAHTETARAMTDAALHTYTLNGIREWDLVTSAGACQVCMDVAAANPHTGDADAAPLHPRCRCAVAPHVTR